MIKLSREDTMRAITDGVAQGLWDIATNRNSRTDVPNELMFDAIRQGTADAMWRLMNHATAMPCADFYAAVEDGCTAGIERVKG